MVVSPIFPFIMAVIVLEWRPPHTTLSNHQQRPERSRSHGSGPLTGAQGPYMPQVEAHYSVSVGSELGS